ncbi:MAG: copper oxidase [Planctomycetes bacterium]|nr:copper oxidase [Planctomycetota bacterium]
MRPLPRQSTLGMYGAALALILASLAGFVFAQHEHHGPAPAANTPQPQPDHDAHAMGETSLRRIEPGRTYSPPPPHMGHQAGRVHAPAVAPLGYEMDAGVKVFTLIAQPVRWHINDGKQSDDPRVPQKNKVEYAMQHEEVREVIGWGYNGSVPGPTIEATQGDTIRVILKNELPEPTSIHWHGIELPNEMDGAAEVTEPPTPPGGTRTYQFKLHQNGTFLYHSHFNVMKQEALGLGGILVIHPPEEKQKPDVDVSILLQQWQLLPGNPNPDVVGMDWNWFTFNGRAAPDIPPLVVKQGQRVRIRLGNLSMDSHPIHLHGYSFKVVGTEGGPIPESAQWPAATVDVPPGSTRDFEFVAWNAGHWMIHCHKVHHMMNSHAQIPVGMMPHGGMVMLLHVEPADEKAPWRHPGEPEGK